MRNGEGQGERGGEGSSGPKLRSAADEPALTDGEVSANPRGRVSGDDSLGDRGLIVTLDGPAGSGKSTVARTLAKRLGLEFLDTGAMYRGVTAAALDAGLDPKAHESGVVDLAHTQTIRFDWRQDPPRLLIGGRDITHRLRDPDTTEQVSVVSSFPAVRRLLVRAQRKIGREHPKLVTEGRDQGSVVFPEASSKFFLDASPQVRAERRCAQLREAGYDPSFQAILKNIVDRDHRDRNRSDGPLICPQDAEKLDTSAMSLEQVVDHLERRVRRQSPHALAEAQGAEAQGAHEREGGSHAGSGAPDERAG